ncbi:hypothetical protein GN244_ATG19007, partial [Phytophthora infestans]
NDDSVVGHVLGVTNSVTYDVKDPTPDGAHHCMAVIFHAAGVIHSVTATKHLVETMIVVGHAFGVINSVTYDVKDLIPRQEVNAVAYSNARLAVYIYGGCHIMLLGVIQQRHPQAPGRRNDDVVGHVCVINSVTYDVKDLTPDKKSYAVAYSITVTYDVKNLAHDNKSNAVEYRATSTWP